MDHIFSKKLQNILTKDQESILEASEKLNQLIDLQIRDLRELYEMVFEANFKKMINNSNAQVMKKRGKVSQNEVVKLIVDSIDIMIAKLQKSIDDHNTVGMSSTEFVEKQKERISNLQQKKNEYLTKEK